jgi:D-glycero-alpha-D-manno-heptose-7-phosphate kinase
MSDTTIIRANGQSGRVVRARAPLRLGLAGGGTDLSPYAETYGGVVVNVTLDRYCHASVSARDDGHVRFEATDLGVSWDGEVGAALDYGTLPLHAGVYARMCRQFGLEPAALTLSTFSDVPAGSGLGGSSALVVAIAEALRTYFSLPLDDYELASLAWSIEREDLGFSGGRQDTFAAVFGGLNVMEFGADGHNVVRGLRVSDGAWSELESSVLLCFSGDTRNSSEFISAQSSNVHAGQSSALDAVHVLKAEALEAKEALVLGDLSRFTESVERSWQAKRQTASSVSTPRIESLLERGLEAGALTGKIAGGGGGGFIWFVVDPAARAVVVRALTELGATASGCHFTTDGVTSWVVG